MTLFSEIDRALHLFAQRGGVVRHIALSEMDMERFRAAADEMLTVEDKSRTENRYKGHIVKGPIHSYSRVVGRLAGEPDNQEVRP